MVKEAYCSYEVAKLLKERGFNEECHYAYHYWPTGAFFHRKKKNFNGSEYQGLNYEWFSCPTHQMACAWIRKKGYNIEVQATASGFIWSIDKLNGTNVKWSNYIGPNDGGAWDDYDECTESALKYCLENLI